MIKGDLLWFDREGIGADTPLSYFGWDFDELATVENIEGELVTLSIKVDTDSNPNEVIRIIASKQTIERLIQKPVDRTIEWLKE